MNISQNKVKQMVGPFYSYMSGDTNIEFIGVMKIQSQTFGKLQYILNKANLNMAIQSQGQSSKMIQIPDLHQPLRIDAAPILSFYFGCQFNALEKIILSSSNSPIYLQYINESNDIQLVDVLVDINKAESLLTGTYEIPTQTNFLRIGTMTIFCSPQTKDRVIIGYEYDLDNLTSDYLNINESLRDLILPKQIEPMDVDNDIILHRLALYKGKELGDEVDIKVRVTPYATPQVSSQSSRRKNKVNYIKLRSKIESYEVPTQVRDIAVEQSNDTLNKKRLVYCCNYYYTPYHELMLKQEYIQYE